MGRLTLNMLLSFAQFEREVNAALIRLLLKARTWWARLADGTIHVATLAREEGVNGSWITRVVRLSPRSIVATLGIPIIWAEQVEMFSTI